MRGGCASPMTGRLHPAGTGAMQEGGEARSCGAGEFSIAAASRRACRRRRRAAAATAAMLGWPGPAVGILSYRENVSYSVTVSMQKKPMQGSTKTLSNFHSGGPGYPGIPGMHTWVPWHTDLDPMFSAGKCRRVPFVLELMKKLRPTRG
jgi:hypothetical protein